MINALQDVPCLVRFSSAVTHDHTFLKELNLQKDSFVVFDKVYNDYTQYLQQTQQDIYFVTRQKDNALFEHIDELDLEDHIDDNILRDEVIEVHKNYLDNIPNQIFTEYSSLGRVYKKEHVVIDKTKDIYNDSLFLNSDHLNEYGATKFTNEVMNVLNSRSL